jgi:alcohol dehydrogenase class IV
MTVSVFQSLPSRVVFGKGALAGLADEAQALGCRRMLVVCTGSQRAVAERAMGFLGDAGQALFPGAAMHTPVEVTQEAMKLVGEHGVDGIVAIGGGSAIGLSKAIALRTDLPQVVAPSTYAGSEMTPVLGQTEGGRKTTQRSAKVLPETVIYDIELSFSLPVQVSVTSGFNAMAHAAEALYAESPTPPLLAIAEECVRLMAHALPRILIDPGDEGCRAAALEAAWLGGWSLANGGSALHHRLCHMLGGAFGLPHAETHTVLLPHVLAYNLPSAPDALQRLGRALNTTEPAEVLFDLGRSLGAPAALKDIGMPKDGIDQAAEAMLAQGGWNPRPLDAASLKRLLRRAWAGEHPRMERGGLLLSPAF